MFALLKRAAENKDAASLAHRMRQRRFEWLRSRLEPLPKPVSVLDVGGTETFWQRMQYGSNGEIDLTILNLEAQPVTLPFARGVAGDARDLSDYADRSFDLVFSNSVIEHLGLFRDQMRMANEVRRVGRRYFVQTPNRFFPLEPHALVPFFQFMPARVTAAVLERRPIGWLPRASDRAAAIAEIESLRLLDRAELRMLFPDAEILEERVLGLVKSFVATAGW